MGHSYKGRRNPPSPVPPLPDYGTVTIDQMNSIVVFWEWTGGNPPFWGIFQDDGTGFTLVDVSPGDIVSTPFVPTDGDSYYVQGLDSNEAPYGTPSDTVVAPFP